MDQPEQPQLYLISPAIIELSSFGNALGELLDAVDVACFRMSLATSDEGELSRAADHLRSICHERDVAIVMDTHFMLAERLGLDGVHLKDGARNVRKARKALGDDAIVGAYCGASRHDGMNAAESGADYVAFGPVGETALGDGTRAEVELFQWWSQMIEVPVVAEGALDEELVRTLSSHTDFFGIGDEIWQDEDPLSRLYALAPFLS